jgi:hypothetical protein
MFTLKLYKHYPEGPRARICTTILAVHSVQALDIAEETMEVRAFKLATPQHYDSFYIGKREPEMTAITDDNHWEWGLLENASGKTTEHFRPYSWG